MEGAQMGAEREALAGGESDANLLDLTRHWTGPLEELPDSIRFGAPEGSAGEQLIPAQRLPEHLDDMLAAMRLHYCGDDSRALISQWSKWYFKAVLPAAIAHAVIARRPLAMPLSACTVVLREGLPCKLWLPHAAAGEPAQSADVRYRSLCIEHLAPFIEALAAAARIAPRVLWSNAGNLFEYTMSLFMQMPQHADIAREDSAFLFGRRPFFDTGESNPLRTPVRYVAAPSPRLENPFRARRVCCLRNQLPQEPLCSSCPLLLTMPKTELETYLDRIEEGS